ncbi:VOC family protein [Paracoccus aminophilus]|uniref:Transcriptional regulator, LysR family n=1 Tax=Paracoccus aminophilus JCM 7686 TaxID=1367847 RepID=S5YS36_PARAH|nr:VOC family protein [Paracoccus aminophilus]AGT08036.1 transcriptional regulator, LysR family [Paracoccus aminophilus JCM 7686]
MATSDAPADIGRVALVVKDLAGMSDFYRSALGLEELARDAEVARLGQGERVLLELRGDKAARIADPRQAGLFHNAFLLPSRADLGAWLRHAADTDLRLDGASDHGVSEALYLRDPEGNGIEIYVDRPRADWPRRDAALSMVTRRLDLNDLAAEARGPFTGAPEDTVIGHVHLQVGDLTGAESFITGPLGMGLTQRMQGASFFSSGGYHHHLAGNIWNSRGAGARPDGATGLADVEIRLTPELYAAASQTHLRDPWGTAFTLSAKG